MHTGQVVSMTPQTTTVRIVSHSACSECHAAGLCGLSEYTEKAIEVPTAPSATYGVGDEVNVVLKATMGLKAVWLAYFLPLVAGSPISSRWSSCWASRSGSSPWAWAKSRPASPASAPWLSITESCGSCATGSGTNTFSLYNNQ